MSLIGLIVTLIIVGVALWLINFIPMDATVREIIRKIGIVAVVVLVFLWLLGFLLGYSGHPGIVHLR